MLGLGCRVSRRWGEGIDPAPKTVRSAPPTGDRLKRNVENVLEGEHRTHATC